MRWNRKRSISKIAETACLSGWEFEADNSPYGVYVYPAIEIEWIAIECSEKAASVELAQSSLGAVSAIFEKWPFVI